MIHYICIILLTLCSCSSFKSSSLPVLEDIRKNNILKVGTTYDYPPFSYQDKNGQSKGQDIKRAKDLAKSLGVNLKLVKTTWKTLSNDLKEKKFHIAMSGISITQERKKYGFFSIPYKNNGKIPISLCKNRFRFNSLTNINLPHVRTIVNSGGTNYDYATMNLANSNLTIFPDNTRVFAQIIKGRADVMITDLAEADYQVKKYKGILCKTMKTPLTKGYLAYYMPKDKQWKQFVDRWLRSKTN